MTGNVIAQLPAGKVAFAAASGQDTIPWRGYATDVPGLLVARLLRCHTLSFGGRQATYGPTARWGIFHRPTGKRVLWLGYRTRREATGKAALLGGFDWSQQEWPDVTAGRLARILNPTTEQVLQDRAAELERQLQSARESLHEVTAALSEAQAELAATQSADQYVVVNATRGPVYRDPGECFVMPGEDSHTFNSLQRAAHAVLDMVLEHGHNLQSARIYRLVPVPECEVQKAFFATVEERKREIGEWHPDGDAPLWLTLRPEIGDPPPTCAHGLSCPTGTHSDEPDDAPGDECTKALAVTGDAQPGEE